jgi:hypothetical protein
MLSRVALCALLLVTASRQPLRAGEAWASAPLSGPPTGLTGSGRLLWNLEALFDQTFGSVGPCIWNRDPRSNWSFTDSCGSLASFDLYFPVFAHPYGTRFHLAALYRRPLAFGNYPVPVLVQGRLVACDRSRKRFLIDFESAQSLALGCLEHGAAYSRFRGVLLTHSGDRNFSSRPLHVGSRTWALDWTYTCSGRRGANRGLVVEVDAGTTPLRQVRRYGARRAYEGETIFDSGFSQYVVKVQVLGKATSTCRWSVWAIKGEA